MPATSDTSQHSSESIDPLVWRTIWTVLVGAIAVLFDTTIVAVALDSLAADLHTSVATIQWISTGYLLALGVTVPLAGWAQRVLGGKRLWIVALGLFLIGSVLSSLAWDAGSLIGFRVVQGVGGGIMLPMMSTLVMQAAGGKSLGRIMSVISLPAVLGPILGPVLGGLILEHLHWSWLFWVNVPFCVAGIILAARVLPSDGPIRKAPLDGIGFALMAPGLVAVLWGLSNANKGGGFGRGDVLLPTLLGIALLAGFAGWTLRRHRHTPSLIDLRLLKRWPLTSSSILLFLASLSLYGAMVLMPLYFQQVRDVSVLEAGLLLIPQGIGTLASRSLAGRLSDSIGTRPLAVVGFLVVAVGTAPFALADNDSSAVLLMGALLVRGFGLGLVTVPLMTLGFRGLTRTQVPDASIITRIAQQVGGSFGTAVITLILTSAATAGARGAQLAGAFQQTFWWATAFAVAGFALSFALPGKVTSVAEPVPGRSTDPDPKIRVG